VHQKAGGKTYSPTEKDVDKQGRKERGEREGYYGEGREGMRVFLPKKGFSTQKRGGRGS